MFGRLKSLTQRAAAAPPVAAGAAGPVVQAAIDRAKASSWLSETNKQMAFTWLKYGFYAAIAAFVIFMVLIVVHLTIYPIFAFSEGDEGLITIPTFSDKREDFTRVPAQPDVSGNVGTVPTDGAYTVGFDTYIKGAFNIQSAPRVLLYRSEEDITLTGNQDTAETLSTKFPDTNLIVWLDPALNDLYVGVRVPGAIAGTTRLVTTPAITNVPIRKVFRTTIVLTDAFVEVYINGTLQRSMPLPGKPTATPPTSYFYTVPGPYSSDIKAANLFFWPHAISVRQIRATGTSNLDEAAATTFFATSS